MQEVQYILNSAGVAVKVSCDVDLEKLEDCQCFETEPELKYAHAEIHKGSMFQAELIRIDDDEVVSNLEGIIDTVDGDVAIYISALEY